MRDTQRARQRHRQREKQAPCREPDVGLNSGTLGSRPEPKADAQPLSHPGVSGVLYQRDILYLLMRHTERGRDTGKGRSRLHAGSRMWDSILGLRPHALSQRQMPNC